MAFFFWLWSFFFIPRVIKSSLHCINISHTILRMSSLCHVLSADFFLFSGKNSNEFGRKKVWQLGNPALYTGLQRVSVSYGAHCSVALAKLLLRDLFSICLCDFILILILQRLRMEHGGGTEFCKQCRILALFL